jgi:hypothetical protein
LRIQVNNKIFAPVLYIYQNTMLNNEMMGDNYNNNYAKAQWALKQLLSIGVTDTAFTDKANTKRPLSLMN